MNSAKKHPSIDELTAFGLGKLDDSAAEPISDHLATCDPCVATLAGLDGDTFIDLVERADKIVPPTHECNRSLDREEDHGPAEVPRELVEHPRYRTVELIGRGGMGDVYRAEHRLMNRDVALKVVNQHLIASPAAAERFRREVQAAAQLSHPNIVTSHDAEQTGDLHFLVMEFVEGTDLAKVVQQRAPLSVETVCDWIAQAATGLQHAHDCGLVHRDVKPHNLMVTSDGTVKILDFGLATVASFAEESLPDNPENGDASNPPPSGLRLTRTGMAMGTPDFMSPEQVVAPRSADARSDIYSLGCTLYYLLTGRPPYAEGSVAEKLSAHGEREPEPLAELRSDVPRELCELVGRMMARNPDDRIQTASAVAEALQSWTGTKTSQSQFRNDRRIPSGWRQPVLAVFGGLAFLAAATVVVLEWNKGTLTIESEADIAIRVMKGEEEYDRMKVTAGATSVRIAAGNYVVEIDGEIEGLSVEDGEVNLLRGTRRVVRIVQSPTEPDNLNVPTGPIISGVVDRKIIYRPPGERDDHADALRAGNLSTHVGQFNRYCQDHPIGEAQPPLTVDEVLSSIRWKLATDESFKEHPQYEELKRIINSHFLPDGWTIKGGPSRHIRRGGKRVFNDWEISLSFVPGGLAARPPIHVIRHRSLQPVHPPGKVETSQDPDGIPLAAAIRAFNDSELLIDGKPQPPLTEDEVLAAIERWNDRRDEAPVVNKDFAAFQRIAVTRTLPKGAKFEVLRGFRPDDGRAYYIYSARILIPTSNQENGTYAFTIREQFIRSRRETDRDRELLRHIKLGFPFGEANAVPHTDQFPGTWKLVRHTDRSVAEWVLEVGGSLSLQLKIGDRDSDWKLIGVRTRSDLPKGNIQLSFVVLQETDIHDHDLVRLRDLDGLSSVNLVGTNVTAAGIEKLRKALPECEIVWDGGTVKARTNVQGRGIPPAEVHRDEPESVGAEILSETIVISQDPQATGLRVSFKDVAGNTQQGSLSLPSRQPSRFVVAITENGRTVREWFGKYRLVGNELTWEFTSFNATGSRISPSPTDWDEVLKQDTSPRHPFGTYRRVE